MGRKAKKACVSESARRRSNAAEDSSRTATPPVCLLLPRVQPTQTKLALLPPYIPLYSHSVHVRASVRTSQSSNPSKPAPPPHPHASPPEGHGYRRPCRRGRRRRPGQRWHGGRARAGAAHGIRGVVPGRVAACHSCTYSPSHGRIEGAVRAVLFHFPPPLPSPLASFSSHISCLFRGNNDTLLRDRKAHPLTIPSLLPSSPIPTSISRKPSSPSSAMPPPTPPTPPAAFPAPPPAACACSWSS